MTFKDFLIANPQIEANPKYTAFLDYFIHIKKLFGYHTLLYTEDVFIDLFEDFLDTNKLELYKTLNMLNIDTSLLAKYENMGFISTSNILGNLTQDDVTTEGVVGFNSTGQNQKNTLSAKNVNTQDVKSQVLNLMDEIKKIKSLNFINFYKYLDKQLLQLLQVLYNI